MDAADAADSSEGADGPAEPESSIPTSCAGDGEPCAPGGRFAQRLCSDIYYGLALYLFSDAVPFSHGYLTRKTEARNASGGVSGTGFLEFDEEVVVLRVQRAAAGGMQVSGAETSYDVLRWDGTCATLSGPELTFREPPKPKRSRIDYRYLDDNIQEALRADSSVNEAYLQRRRECRGAVSGEVSLKCVRADKALMDSVVEYVRQGGELPLPDRLPE